MSRGNRRDLDRLKNQKKNQPKGKGKETTMSGNQMKQNNENTADMMRQKQIASDARKAAAALEKAKAKK
ncbi:hypothetical protein NM208_g11895 [Fusarium decemcellulare]|uniref:Uncharacterized protein n=1 Tax=Fusarium decemcellulare TaxID=57161 RepID=A0ACC1RSQ7_9HYPO|nr:hypothetical protein NM208_g11895 [Fusarium decemcellulare]